MGPARKIGITSVCHGCFVITILRPDLVDPLEPLGWQRPFLLERLQDNFPDASCQSARQLDRLPPGPADPLLTPARSWPADPLARLSTAAESGPRVRQVKSDPPQG